MTRDDIDEAALMSKWNHLCAMPSASVTMTRAELRAFLLRSDGFVMACGEGYDIASVPLGAGVYRVRLVRR